MDDPTRVVRVHIETLDGVTVVPTSGTMYRMADSKEGAEAPPKDDDLFILVTTQAQYNTMESKESADKIQELDLRRQEQVQTQRDAINRLLDRINRAKDVLTSTVGRRTVQQLREEVLAVLNG